MSFISTSGSARGIERCLSRPFLVSQRRMAVIAYGKKRRKRFEPSNFVADTQPHGSVADYLEFGAALGLTVEESLERIKANMQTKKLELDAEAQAMIQKIQKQRERREEMKKEMQRVVNGEVDWEELKEQMQKGEGGHHVQTVPVWAKAKKFLRPQVRMEDLIPDDEEETDNDRAAYGRFLLNNADIDEDFSYDDLEAMISQLPENLIEEGRWHEDTSDMVPLTKMQHKSDASKRKKKATPMLTKRPSLYGEAPEIQENEEKEKETAPQMRKKTRKPVPLQRPQMKTTKAEDPIPEPKQEHQQEMSAVSETSHPFDTALDPKLSESPPPLDPPQTIPSSPTKVLRPKKTFRLRPRPSRHDKS